MLVQVGSCPHDYCWHSLEECNPDASNNRATYGPLGNAGVGAGVVGAAPGVGVRVSQRAHEGLAVRAVAARNAARIAAAVVVKVPALPAPTRVVVAARVVHAAPWQHPSIQPPVSVWPFARINQAEGRLDVCVPAMFQSGRGSSAHWVVIQRLPKSTFVQ